MNNELIKMANRFCKLVNVACEAMQSHAICFDLESCEEIEYSELFGFRQAIELLHDEFNEFDEAIRSAKHARYTSDSAQNSIY